MHGLLDVTIPFIIKITEKLQSVSFAPRTLILKLQQHSIKAQKLRTSVFLNSNF